MNRPGRITINKEQNLLVIEWADGMVTEIQAGALRRYCPCAHCAGERADEPDHFIPIFSREQTAISSLAPVGQYALQVVWKDGHSTGIYEFELLKSLASLNGAVSL